MEVADVLAAKGAGVRTVRPGETIATLAHRLRYERIGALIVSEDGCSALGIVSERDVTYGLAEYGNGLLDRTVGDLMTQGLVTCAPDEPIAAVARVMTHRRIRHLPVMEGGRLVGMVSLGDIVKHRLDEMELESNVLRDYAVARH